MLFYVSDIVFAYCTNRKRVVESLIALLKYMFEIRNMKSVKFFLEVRIIETINSIHLMQEIIETINSIHLMQDIYIDKLVKDYAIDTNLKASLISLSVKFVTEWYEEDVDQSRMHEYRKKMRSVCYSAVISRSDIVKVVLKLTEHLMNSESTHLIATTHLIRHLYKTKRLEIRYDVSESEELIANQANEKHVFEATTDAAFANEKERRSIEEYTFKLFDDFID